MSLLGNLESKVVVDTLQRNSANMPSDFGLEPTRLRSSHKIFISRFGVQRVLLQRTTRQFSVLRRSLEL
jgi:hypothetical protein